MATNTYGSAPVTGYAGATDVSPNVQLQADQAVVDVLQDYENRAFDHGLEVAGYATAPNGQMLVYYKDPSGHVIGSRVTSLSIATLNTLRENGFGENVEPPPGGYVDYGTWQSKPAQRGITPAGNPIEGGGGVQINPTPPNVTYTVVDNGHTALSEFGFGANDTSQGGPVGGSPNQEGGRGGAQGGSAQDAGMYRPGGIITRPSTSTGTGTTSGGTGSATGGTSGLSTEQRDAYAYLKELLDQYGLGSLAGFVQSELIAGRSQAEIALDLRKTPEFAAAFPEIAAREKAGLPPISPGEIISYRNAAGQMMRAAGLPEGFYDSPNDFAQMIGGNVSLAELSDRITRAKEATYNIDPNSAKRLSQMFGLAPGSGGLTAYFLDPKKALPLLERQAQAAKIGGAADNVGYAGLNNATALDLAQSGVSADEAREGFNKLQHERELFTGLPGERADTIGMGTQLASQFLGNVSSQERIERRRQARQAAFDDGGSFAGSQQGMTGLGSVSR